MEYGAVRYSSVWMSAPPADVGIPGDKRSQGPIDRLMNADPRRDADVKRRRVRLLANSEVAVREVRAVTLDGDAQSAR